MQAEATGAVFLCEYFAPSITLYVARRLRRFDVITARRCRISRAANANTSQEKATLLPPLRWSRRRQSLATVSSDPERMSGRTRKIKNEKAKKELIIIKGWWMKMNAEKKIVEWKGLNLINLVFLFLNNQLLSMHHFNGSLSLLFEILNRLIRWSKYSYNFKWWSKYW